MNEVLRALSHPFFWNANAINLVWTVFASICVGMQAAASFDSIRSLRWAKRQMHDDARLDQVRIARMWRRSNFAFVSLGLFDLSLGLFAITARPTPGALSAKALVYVILAIAAEGVATYAAMANWRDRDVLRDEDES